MPSERLFPYQIRYKSHYYVISLDGKAAVGLRTKEEALGNIAARRIAQRLFLNGKIKEEEYGLAVFIIGETLPYILEEARLANTVEVEEEGTFLGVAGNPQENHHG